MAETITSLFLLLFLLRLGGCQALSSSLDDAACHAVWIAVGCRTPVFHVAPSLLLCGTWDTDGGASVGNSELELSDAASLVLACQALVVALSVLGNVLRCHRAKCLADLRDDFIATLRTHRCDREVCVAACTVPITIL